jgi:hypothetical protein
MGIKIYNSRPTYIKKETINTKEFESLLKNFLSPVCYKEQGTIYHKQ